MYWADTESMLYHLAQRELDRIACWEFIASNTLCSAPGAHSTHVISRSNALFEKIPSRVNAVSVDFVLHAGLDVLVQSACNLIL